MIRAVLFDFDGALTTDPSGWSTTIAHPARVTGIPGTRLREGFAPSNEDLPLGRTTHAAIRPLPCVFRHALDRPGVQPHLPVFIDNTPRNLVAPAARGMHAIHFDHVRNDVGGRAGMLRDRFGIAA